MDDMSNKEVSQKIAEWMRETKLKVIRESAMWMRLRILAHEAANAKAKGFSDEDLDWDTVNELIMLPSPVEYDYNLVHPVHTADELIAMSADCDMAGIMQDMPWHKQKCKACGAEFTLTYSEVEWFKRKEMVPPKRCRYCRKGIERPKKTPEPVRTPKAEEPAKTAMQIAMEKAGII